MSQMDDHYQIVPLGLSLGLELISEAKTRGGG